MRAPSPLVMMLSGHTPHTLLLTPISIFALFLRSFPTPSSHGERGGRSPVIYGRGTWPEAYRPAHRTLATGGTAQPAVRPHARPGEGRGRIGAQHALLFDIMHHPFWVRSLGVDGERRHLQGGLGPPGLGHHSSFAANLFPTAIPTAPGPPPVPSSIPPDLLTNTSPLNLHRLFACAAQPCSCWLWWHCLRRAQRLPHCAMPY